MIRRIKYGRKEPCNADPDKWFRGITHGGAMSQDTIDHMVSDLEVAIGICQNHCPVKDRCKELGMRDENLEHGVWGGMLAGERLMEAGWEFEDTTPGSEKHLAFVLLGYVRPELKTWGKSWLRRNR